MIQLHTLKPLVKKRKVIGRGGSRGGTSGKGSKGQNARSGGGVRASFEGGQMPLLRRTPKRGFNNEQFRDEVLTVDVKRITDFFQEGQVVTIDALIEHNVIKPKKSKGLFKVKVLGNQASKKMVIQADAFSKGAQKALSDIGGEARLIEEK
jgi:large subunit ribosomal protein L15